VAINRFLGEGKLANLIGNVFERDGRLVLPFPHPSGANVWLNRPESKRLIEVALDHLRQLKQDTQLLDGRSFSKCASPVLAIVDSGLSGIRHKFFLLN